MLLFLAKLLYVLLAILCFPTDLIRHVIYNYIIKNTYDKLMKDAKKMFGGNKFDNLHQKQ